MSAKLNQIIAVLAGVKTRSAEHLTAEYHLQQKTPLLNGLSRTYQPKTEDGDQLPSEQTRVQVRVSESLERAATAVKELMDATAQQEYANCEATANIVVGDQTLAEKVPVSYLLFLEKQLVNWHTFISKLPTLDQSESWKWDKAQNCWATDPAETVRTKKVPRAFVKAEATDKHPAQVDTWHEDVPVGTWRVVKFSGAMETTRVKQLLERVEALQKAVKFAREEANSREAPPVQVAKKLFDYLMA